MSDSEPHTPEGNQAHELFKFMAQVTDLMGSEYERISDRAPEDPGTAGDDGEENWAELMREWLPPYCHVETKGRILGHDGTLSPQVDVLVLHASYPRKLHKRKTYLASGVLAAFECKLTLRSDHIGQAFKTARALHDLQAPRVGNPYDELHHPIIFGLLAHSHEWKGAASKPHTNVEKAIDEAHQRIAQRPCDLPDVLCVADLSTWSMLKISSAGMIVRQPWTKLVTPDINTSPVTDYMKSVTNDYGRETTPIGSMFAKLLSRISLEDSAARPISRSFALAGVLGSGENFSRRIWPSPYSDEVSKRLPTSLVGAGDNRWGLVFL